MLPKKKNNVSASLISLVSFSMCHKRKPTNWFQCVVYGARISVSMVLIKWLIALSQLSWVKHHENVSKRKIFLVKITWNTQNKPSFKRKKPCFMLLIWMEICIEVTRVHRMWTTHPKLLCLSVWKPIFNHFVIYHKFWCEKNQEKVQCTRFHQSPFKLCNLHCNKSSTTCNLFHFIPGQIFTYHSQCIPCRFFFFLSHFRWVLQTSIAAHVFTNMPR